MVEEVGEPNAKVRHPEEGVAKGDEGELPSGVEKGVVEELLSVMGESVSG